MVDAAYWNEDIQQAYFFGGTRYARIKFTPGTPEEKITWGPETITRYWPSLVKAGFGTVDAVLPVPGVKGEAYFFRGSRYVRIKVVPETSDDTIVYGPHKITDKWASLAKAGFDTVDAAMEVPGKDGEAYFFRGANYVRVHVWDDKVVYGPAKLATEWPGLTEAGFDTVDAALPIAKGNGETYFFNGINYVKIRVVASAPDKITYGPKPIADHWKTLNWV
ncbi:Hemopexin-like domain-containing protein [Talaromyces proteolyticus]|uniref:Hemopexin-like domain-containing protein n=1 Tax=Talaromyces proteolyticus TaxID=1131652 RepID=A0AAD4KIT0_9EURO|nr:Hemopexin-like domain-containing protein [Talaromyces proteolyticus]KAH8690290.1 Hemopexin-like domain-containing protein [Talaromyces proteolyticus]